MSIAKISDANYYLAAVANGIEDYYTLGEAPGRWTGHTHQLLGLDGPLAPEQLTAVLAGRHPDTGALLIESANRTVPAFDLTFRAPKSVSLAFALGEPWMTDAVMAAHDAAVDAALGYLERHAAVSRTGHNGVDQAGAEGFIAAAFRHRTSRAAEPHLHTHVLVPNMVRTADGRWRTLDARHLYAQSLTAGYLYEAHLREEITRRLGLSWGPVVNGIADIDGIPAGVLRAFSTRRQEIEAHLSLHGATSARAAEVAALDTRQAKNHALDMDQLRSDWSTRATSLGFPPDRLAGLVDPARQQLRIPATPAEVTRIETLLLGPEGLTAMASTFDRRDVIRALASAYRDGANVRLLEAHADVLLTHPDVVKVSDTTADTMRSDTGRAISRVELGARYSTTELIALEQHLVTTAIQRHDDRTGFTTRQAHSDALAARPTLSAEQQLLVETITLRRSGVDVVTAPAGAGKTFALAAATAAWTADGRHVHGAALSARAATELQSSAGMEAVTLARLAGDVTVIGAGDVVVIDEFGMAPTRLVAPIFTRAAQVGAKLVLVGDPRQLPEIGAGGLLAGLSARLPTVELSENRRQRHTWEQIALAELRNGRVATALDAYERHGRIVTHDTALDTKTRLVADWATARTAGADVIMLASRRADIADLNLIARHHRHTIGALTGPVRQVTAGEQVLEFQAGDEIMLLRNDQRLGIRNGQRATITTIHERSNIGMTIRTTDGKQVGLPAWYLDRGHVTHGYAMTVHKAQGLTCDQALVYATDDLYRELGYVALSRGRDLNRLYVPARVRAELEAHAPTVEKVRAQTVSLLAGLTTSRAQELAIDTRTHGTDRPLEEWTTVELAGERQRLRQALNAQPRDHAREITDTQRTLAQLNERLPGAQQRCDELEHRWTPIMERLRGPSRELTVARQDRDSITAAIVSVGAELGTLRHAQAASRRYFESHRGDQPRIDRIDQIINERIDHAVATDMIDTPDYLRTLIGEYRSTTRPQRWVDTAHQIERYRHTNAITDPTHALGQRPDGIKVHEWDSILDHATQVQAPEQQTRRGMRMR